MHLALAAPELREAADGLFLSGDLALARRFYRLGAETGDGRAALRLGETFDPAILSTLMAPAKMANPAEAAKWYRRARDLGSTEAARLLSYVEQPAPTAPRERAEARNPATAGKHVVERDRTVSTAGSALPASLPRKPGRRARPSRGRWRKSQGVNRDRQRRMHPVASPSGRCRQHGGCPFPPTSLRRC